MEQLKSIRNHLRFIINLNLTLNTLGMENIPIQVQILSILLNIGLKQLCRITLKG